MKFSIKLNDAPSRIIRTRLDDIIPSHFHLGWIEMKYLVERKIQSIASDPDGFTIDFGVHFYSHPFLLNHPSHGSRRTKELTSMEHGLFSGIPLLSLDGSVIDIRFGYLIVRGFSISSHDEIMCSFAMAAERLVNMPRYVDMEKYEKICSGIVGGYSHSPIMI